ncbi:hypothetical protein PACTADRAFT_51076 [Pachysolen tannophilus NRRL Y-2460]|uniref:Cytoplasmic tRNA 2-thiolation protein 2 n=1 Tax=Pachysolen tannophilus NRRL Y-2460 TaxID=669874 RepID=A0A1E4TR30_PACTA|nr:hypothetical protein PACTADRAFT_51076 [Pachysolen tannophilus NRRL Y-2460]
MSSSTTKAGAVVCSRCKIEESLLVTRKEAFCSSCFTKFISNKQRKLMSSDKFKVKYGKQVNEIHKVLLCLSFGRSSLVLLDIIINLLKEQRSIHRGRQGFKLVVIDIEFKILNIDSFLSGSYDFERIKLFKDFNSMIIKDGSSLDEKFPQTVQELLSKCSSNSSVEDLLDIIYNELYFNTCKSEDCHTMIFGHSMTKLAVDILALTIKGRGSLVNQRVTDGIHTYQKYQVEVVHPLRDVLDSEIDKYLDLNNLMQFCDNNNDTNTTLAIKKLTKNMTIGEITRRYFDTLDKDYSETVSTVVKIGSKLIDPISEKNDEKDDNNGIQFCKICNCKIFKNPQAWLNRITVEEPFPITNDEERAAYEMYKEAALQISPDNLEEEEEEEEEEGVPQKEPISLCYGCLVTIGGVPKEGLDWPVRNQETQEILNEYILTDNGSDDDGNDDDNDDDGGN